ncbi:MAG: seryl-tRNA synthetase [Desulforhopalus sp.]|jgi:seryl-tRNA synthetase
MNALNMSNSFMQLSIAKEHKPATQIHIKQTKTPSVLANKEMASEKVTISPEARSPVAEESSNEKSREALHNLATTDEDTAVSKESQVEAIDKMIEKLREEINELMQQIAKLQANGDAKSIEQAKALEAQVAALNSQLMELTGRKPEMLELGV